MLLANSGVRFPPLAGGGGLLERDAMFRQDDPLAAHVLIVGAFDLLRQYAKTKGIELRSDFLNRLPPDLAKEAIGGLKMIYNFARHSDRDPDQKIDIAKLTPFTDGFIAITAQMYKECFKSETRHMELFRAFVAIHHPEAMSEEWNRHFSALPAARQLAKLPRSDQLENLRLLFEQPDLYG